MKFRSVFDVIGPIMIGPSSSHTAGAARIGKTARRLFGREPKWANITLYESFKETYRGHGTDVALIGGLLNYETSDERIRTALETAERVGLRYTFQLSDEEVEHPNTARLQIGDATGELELVAISIGGGMMEVVELNGFPLRLSGNYPALLVVHSDRPGVIAQVANKIAERGVNIAHMEVGRKEKGDLSLMVIEVDQVIDDYLIRALQMTEHVTQVATLSE